MTATAAEQIAVSGLTATHTHRMNPHFVKGILQSAVDRQTHNRACLFTGQNKTDAWNGVIGSRQGRGWWFAAAGEQSCQGSEFRKAASPDILWSNNYKSLSGFLESVHDVHDAERGGGVRTD